MGATVVSVPLVSPATGREWDPLGLLAQLVLHDEPFRWALGQLPPAAVAPLVETFPLERLTEQRRVEGSKTYLNESRTLLDEDTGVDERTNLSPAWAHLVAAIVAPGYRAALSERVGVDLAATSVECRLVRHAAGGHLGPHTDRPDKLVTQLWYFSDPGWDVAWGGRLQVLGSAGADDVFTSVAPTAGTSVVLVRSDRSWHAVEAVADTAPQPRLSLLAHFRRSGGSDG